MPYFYMEILFTVIPVVIIIAILQYELDVRN